MKLERYRFSLTTIFFFFVIVLSCMFAEGVDFLKVGFSPFVLKDTLFGAIAVFIGILTYVIIERKKNRAKIDWIVLPFFLLLTVIGLIGQIEPYISASLGNPINEFYHVTQDQLITNILILVLGNTVTYLLLAIVPKRIAKANTLCIVYWCIVLVGVVAIIYSLIVEKESYKIIFSDEENVELVYNSIKSFFYNENNYGQLLMLCIISCLIINAAKPHWWHFLFVIFLFGGMIFSTSFTSLATSLIAVFIYLLYELIYTWRKHVIRNCIYFTAVIFGITLLVILFVTLASQDIKPFSSLQNFIAEKILDKNYQTASGRLQVWNMSISTLINPMQLMFGHGNGLTLPYITAYTSNVYGHTIRHVDSGFVEVLCTNGVFGLVVYISMICCLIALCFVLAIKKKQKLAIPILICLIALLIYSSFESLVLFAPNTIGVVSSCLIALPLLIQFNKISKQPVVQTNTMLIKINAHKLTSGQIVTLYSLPFFLVGIFFLTALFIPSFIPHNVCLAVIILSFGLFFTFPYLVAMIRRKSIGRWFLAKFIILLGITLLIPGLSVLILLLLGKGYTISLIVGGALYVLMILMLDTFYFITVSSVKEYFTLIFKDIILAYLTPILIYVIIFIPLTFIVVSLNATFTAYMFYMGGMIILFFMAMLLIPSPTKSNKKFVRLIDELNARLLLAQKMVFVLDK